LKDANLEAYTLLGLYGCGYPKDVFSTTRRNMSLRLPLEGGSDCLTTATPTPTPNPHLNVCDYYDLNLILIYDYNVDVNGMSVGRFDEMGWEGARSGEVSTDGHQGRSRKE
jgi:hypothetical protein